MEHLLVPIKVQALVIDDLVINKRGALLVEGEYTANSGRWAPLSQDYLYVSAFHDPAGGRVVVVAVNQKYSDLQQDFRIAGGTVTQLTTWLTATGTNLQAQGAVSVVDGKFTAQLPARSVTTFVGTATP